MSIFGSGFLFESDVMHVHAGTRLKTGNKAQTNKKGASRFRLPLCNKVIHIYEPYL